MLIIRFFEQTHHPTQEKMELIVTPVSLSDCTTLYRTFWCDVREWHAAALLCQIYTASLCCFSRFAMTTLSTYGYVTTNIIFFRTIQRDFSAPKNPFTSFFSHFTPFIPPFDLTVHTLIGVYAKPTLPFTPSFDLTLHTLIGWTSRY